MSDQNTVLVCLWVPPAVLAVILIWLTNRRGK